MKVVDQRGYSVQPVTIEQMPYGYYYGTFAGMKGLFIKTWFGLVSAEATELAWEKSRDTSVMNLRRVHGTIRIERNA